MPLIIAIALGISLIAGAGYTATHHNVDSNTHMQGGMYATTTAENNKDKDKDEGFFHSLGAFLHLNGEEKGEVKNDNDKEHSTNATTTAEMHANENSRVITSSTTPKIKSESSLGVDLDIDSR